MVFKKIYFEILVSRQWGKHPHTQSCSNLSRHAHCLPIAASIDHLIGISVALRIMGAPAIQTTELAYQLRVCLPCITRRKSFLYFYFILCEADKVLDQLRDKSDSKRSSGKDYGTHGRNSSFFHTVQPMEIKLKTYI